MLQVSLVTWRLEPGSTRTPMPAPWRAFCIPRTSPRDLRTNEDDVLEPFDGVRLQYPELCEQHLALVSRRHATGLTRVDWKKCSNPSIESTSMSRASRNRWIAPVVVASTTSLMLAASVVGDGLHLVEVERIEQSVARKRQQDRDQRHHDGSARLPQPRADGSSSWFGKRAHIWGERNRCVRASVRHILSPYWRKPCTNAYCF